MKVMRVPVFVVLLAASGAISVWGGGAAVPEGNIVAAPGDLKWSDVASLAPGAKIAVIEGDLKAATPFTFRLKFPPGYKLAVHTHPVTERVTVVSGVFNLGFGEGFDPDKTMKLTPGSVAIMPAGTKMYAYTKEETIVQLHGVGPWGITYANPADDPRKK